MIADETQYRVTLDAIARLRDMKTAVERRDAMVAAGSPDPFPPWAMAAQLDAVLSMLAELEADVQVYEATQAAAAT